MTSEDKSAARAQSMPTEKDAIRAMYEAWTRLKELGWREGEYMPKDGKRYAGIQSGSTGIHAFTARPLEAGGTMYEVYDGDIWPTRTPPVVFRPWKTEDVQVRLRPAYPIPEDTHPSLSPDRTPPSPKKEAATGSNERGELPTERCTGCDGQGRCAGKSRCDECP